MSATNSTVTDVQRKVLRLTYRLLGLNAALVQLVKMHGGMFKLWHNESNLGIVVVGGVTMWHEDRLEPKKLYIGLDVLKQLGVIDAK